VQLLTPRSYLLLGATTTLYRAVRQCQAVPGSIQCCLLTFLALRPQPQAARFLLLWRLAFPLLTTRLLPTPQRACLNGGAGAGWARRSSGWWGVPGMCLWRQSAAACACGASQLLRPAADKYPEWGGQAIWRSPGLRCPGLLARIKREALCWAGHKGATGTTVHQCLQLHRRGNACCPPQ